MIPIARNQNLVIQHSGDELLVYDLETNKAVCLNSMAAMVWERCDGVESPHGIRMSLQSELGRKVSEDLVWFALEQLHKENLLANTEDFPQRYEGESRRSIIKKIGLGSAVALPLVASLFAPTSLSAQSGACVPNGPLCLPNGNVGCNSDNDCCSCNCDTMSGNCVT